MRTVPTLGVFTEPLGEVPPQQRRQKQGSIRGGNKASSGHSPTHLVWLSGALDDGWRPNTVPTGGGQGVVLTMSGCFPVAGLRCLSRDDGGMAAQDAPRFLLTFDFDETIVDENSDDSIVRAAPGQRLPESLRATYREGFYNEYMQRVFQYLGEQGVRPRDLRAVYEAIPLSPGMSDLLQFVAKHGSCFEVILISDANTFGVESALRAAGHHGLFRRILSNPSGPDARGLLALRPFHTHSCARCPANMCKHKVLSDYLRERAHDGVHFERLFYVGDGANDFCPMGLLAGGDVAFPRRGYPMHRLIQEAQKAEPSSFHASVVPWETAIDVRLHLQQVLKTC